MKTLIDFIGIPYQPRGIPPKAADCWTLIRSYAENVLEQNWPERMYDDDDRFLDQAAQLLILELEAISLGKRWRPVDRIAHGDVLLYRFRGQVSHCAVCVGSGDMLHSLQGRMSCIEPMSNWTDRLYGAFRWTGK